MADEGVRLAKRVAALVPCSRAEAERYIAGGWVAVDGVVVEEPATRVLEQQDVVLLPGATATDPGPVTIVLHKPAGMSADAAIGLLTPDRLEGREQFLKRHVSKQAATLGLEDEASGMLVFTQDYNVARKLNEIDRFEQEFVAQVQGELAAEGLAALNRKEIKVSWQSEGRLRFAGKGIKPGQVSAMCRGAGLEVVSLKRLRIGRVSLSKLPEGHWRYLTAFERF